MNIKPLLLATGLFSMMTACFEDKSVEDFELVKPIQIEFWDTQATSQKVFQMDTLEIVPIIYKQGVKDEDLEFEWKIQGNNAPETILSHKMVLKEQITIAPNSKAYELILTVRDKTTSLEEYARINLTVESKFGEGLLVADTRDEMNSDISLIMSRNFTRYLLDKNKKIHYNVYSSMNHGQKIPGLIKDIQSDVQSDSRVLTFMTNTDIYRIDPYDFVDWQRNNELFYVPLEEIHPVQLLKKDYGGDEFMIVNGKLHYRNASWGNLYYSYYLFTPDEADYRLSRMMNVGSGYYTTPPYAYDEAQNRFIQASSRNDAFIQFIAQEPGLLFDVNNIGSYDAVHMDEGENSNLNTVLKAEDGSGYFVYAIQSKTPDNGRNLPVGKYDLSACTDILNAKAFLSSPISEDFYYATPDKIYALVLKSDQPNPVSDVRYTAKPGEQITGMMLWKGEYQRMNVPDDSQPSGVREENAHNRMLVITTYNESTQEGKVITIPIIRLGDGTLETNQAFHNEYGGFGRITKIAYNKIGY